MVDWALLYAGRGFAVFPLHSISSGQCTCKAREECKSPGKHPYWERDTLTNGLSDATADPKLIKLWWGKWPSANIGIATGRISGVFVVDIDGEAGAKSIKSLQRRYGKLPKTLIAQTGRGAHLYFHVGGDEIKNHTGIVPGIDIRGCGGYVVAPPSVHISGKRYRFSNEESVGHPSKWLRQMLGSERKQKETPQREYDRPKPHVRPCDVPMISKGSRNSELIRWGGRWVWEDKSIEEVRALLEEVNRTRCKPPVSDRELRGILRSVMRYQ